MDEQQEQEAQRRQEGTGGFADTKSEAAALDLFALLKKKRAVASRRQRSQLQESRPMAVEVQKTHQVSFENPPKHGP